VQLGDFVSRHSEMCFGSTASVHRFFTAFMLLTLLIQWLREPHPRLAAILLTDRVYPSKGGSHGLDCGDSNGRGGWGLGESAAGSKGTRVEYLNLVLTTTGRIFGFLREIQGVGHFVPTRQLPSELACFSIRIWLALIAERCRSDRIRAHSWAQYPIASDRSPSFASCAAPRRKPPLPGLNQMSRDQPPGVT
jgi:hypothetical protein